MIDHKDKIYRVWLNPSKVTPPKYRDYIRYEIVKESDISYVYHLSCKFDGIGMAATENAVYIKPRNIKDNTTHWLERLNDFIINEKLGSLLNKL